jgi:outer membrane protein TolC
LLAKKDVSIAKTQLREAKSLFYPKINLNLNYARYKNETLGLTSFETGNLVLEPSDPEVETLYMGRVGFIQPIYAGGRYNYTLKQSKANVRQAESSFESLKQEVAFKTASAFYQLVASQLKVKSVERVLLELDRMKRLAVDDHSLLSLQFFEIETRRLLSEIQEKENDLRYDYLGSMGVELFSDLEVDGDLDIGNFSDDLPTVLTQASKNRPELRDTLLQEEVDQLSVQLSLAERYPVFLLGGGMEVRKNDFPLDQTNWNAVLSMNIPVFDGFSSRARIRESRYRADQGRLRKAQLQDQVDREVRTAHHLRSHWEAEKLRRQKELDELGKSKNKYFPNGNRSVRDSLDFSRWYLQTEISLIEAKLECCLAQAQYAKALGQPLP